MKNDIDIARLIPQRSPFQMVDRLLEVDGTTARTRFAVGANNYFLQEDKTMAWAGVMEHIAQSASAMAGYIAITAGAEEPPQGILAEVKRFLCHRQPVQGDVLTTEVTKGVEVNGVAIIYGKTFVDEELVAETQMKIFIPPMK